jgi:hypothetical protein
MHALKTCLRAAFVGVITTSGVAAVGALTAHAETVRPAGNEQRPDSLAQAAAGLPKVSPADMIKLATRQIGVRENSDGGGTKFQEWYMSTPRARQTVARDGGSIADYENAPWCDIFVSWLGGKLGIQPVMGSDSYTVEHARWFAEHNRWGDTPKPGAVVFYSWDGGKSLDDIDHVGIVVKDNGDGTIKTVEGNTGSGEVMSRTRSTGDVVGYGYPFYTAP